MLLKDQAICIRAVDYSETSQVVTFFARNHGKVGAIAKGAKRPKSAFGGPIEPFSYGDLVLADSPSTRLATLTEFQPRFDVVRGLSGSLPALHAALLASELLDKLTQDRDPHPGLYEGFLQFLQEAVTTRSVLPALIGFQSVLLRQIGLQPVLDQCANCQLPYAQTWPGRYFSSSANGLVCGDCEGAFADRLSLAGPVVQAWAGPDGLGTADLQVLRTIEGILIGHFTNLLHHRPNCAVPSEEPIRVILWASAISTDPVSRSVPGAHRGWLGYPSSRWAPLRPHPLRRAGLCRRTTLRQAPCNCSAGCWPPLQAKPQGLLPAPQGCSRVQAGDLCLFEPDRIGPAKGLSNLLDKQVLSWLP